MTITSMVEPADDILQGNAADCLGNGIINGSLIHGKFIRDGVGKNHGALQAHSPFFVDKAGHIGIVIDAVWYWIASRQRVSICGQVAVAVSSVWSTWLKICAVFMMGTSVFVNWLESSP